MVVTHGHLSQLWANMFLSMASLILLMKLRFLYQEIQRRMKRHRNYVMVNQTLQERCSLSLSLYRPRKALNIICITPRLLAPHSAILYGKIVLAQYRTQGFSSLMVSLRIPAVRCWLICHLALVAL